MKKFLFPFILLFILFFYKIAEAKIVDISQCRTVAINFYTEKYASSSEKHFYISDEFSIKASDTCLAYIFNINNKGFVIVSANDAYTPVLAYSSESNYAINILPPAFAEWLKVTKQQLLYSLKNQLSENFSIDNEWKRLSCETSVFSSKKNTKGVLPLITAVWAQGACYNDMCPVDAAGPGGHAKTGCVGTAMGQVMFYYKYPVQGNGSNSYASTYGTLSADFANTTYDWKAMKNVCSGSNSAIATLLYHCGISTNTIFSATASGTTILEATIGFVKYFKYDSSIAIASIDSMSANAWDSIVKYELDKKRPVIFSGSNPITSAGHAFVCDGYQDSNYFHFNWGWSGSSNGYFYLNSLTPGTANYTYNQRIIYKIFPPNGYHYDTEEKNMDASQLQIYPNPASQSIHIDFNESDNRCILLQLINYTGEIIYAKQSFSSAGNLCTDIDISAYAKGAYLARLITETEIFTKKIIIK